MTSATTNHKPPCAAVTVLMALISVLVCLVLYSIQSTSARADATETKMAQMEKTVTKNAEDAREARTRFEYIAQTLTDIKDELKRASSK